MGNTNASAIKPSSTKKKDDLPIVLVINGNMKAERNAAGSFTALFKGEYGKRTAIVWFQWILYDLAAYGIGLYSPIEDARSFVGSNSIA